MRNSRPMRSSQMSKSLWMITWTITTIEGANGSWRSSCLTSFISSIQREYIRWMFQTNTCPGSLQVRFGAWNGNGVKGKNAGRVSIRTTLDGMTRITLGDESSPMLLSYLSDEGQVRAEPNGVLNFYSSNVQ